MQILNTVLPIFLVIGVGYVLGSIGFIAPRLFVQNYELEDAAINLPTTIHNPLAKGETLPWHVRSSLEKMVKRADVAQELERIRPTGVRAQLRRRARQACGQP